MVRGMMNIVVCEGREQEGEGLTMMKEELEADGMVTLMNRWFSINDLLRDKLLDECKNG